MVVDRSTRIGCAIANYQSDGLYTLLLVCNYALTNMEGEAIYQTGTVASECQTGNDKKYTGLCSPNEKYVFT